ncbi:DUF5106 domain-containing protein [Bacteroidales bacterium OttesenSCG-928-C03]|nr:DUF5106 domain-containing protein [Bacteroidales bacterium OttesenSCG-928-C03]MDL2326777.1 DUF5106 domain-containing protein [Bacteroidales bacterium OttesenSCG-928-A14]
MKRTIAFAFILALTFQPAAIQAQKNIKAGHKLVFHVKGASDPIVYLAIHHRNSLYLRDSAKISAPGTYVFEGKETCEDGLYSLVSAEKSQYLNFVIDKNYHFEYFLDTTGNVMNFSVKNSPENTEMLAFQQQAHLSQQEIKRAIQKRKEFDAVLNPDSVDFYMEKQKEINGRMEDFINDLIARNPDFLFSKLQKAYMPITVPDPPVKEDGTIDSTYQHCYYLTHFWDNTDLADGRFVYLPVLEELYQQYFHQMLYFQKSDTIIKYVDAFLAKTEADSLMFRYMVDRLRYDCESSKILGHDAVFVHIAKNYHLNGKCPWLPEETIAKYRKRVSRLEPILIGKPAPELIIPDMTGGKLISSHKLKAKYVILWFFDPDCQTCKRESAELKQLYDSLLLTGTLNFEVYAIGKDKDEGRLKKYVDENDFKWINVNGNSANINYLDEYNIYESGNPSLFILDENRIIILNRRIGMQNIPNYIERVTKN